MNILKLFIIGVAALALCGCASTTITEYDADGRIVKVSETDESAFVLLAQSAKDKDNFVHASGWAVGVQPSVGIYGVGAFDLLGGSINKDTGTRNALSYAAMINASKVSLDVTATADGITANSKTETANANETSTDPHAGATEPKDHE